MRNLSFMAALLLSITSFAKNPIFEFKKRAIVLIDASSGKPIKDQQVGIYHRYEYPCFTDRPGKCVDGSYNNLPVTNGKLNLEAQQIEKSHILGNNPKVGIQVSGLCDDQEWHPGYCEVWIPLSEFNKATDPMVIRIPFKKTNTSIRAIQPQAQ